MPAQLIALTDGPDILLDKPILLLGRHPECDIQIDSRKISRRHCCIAQVDNHLIVRDLGSTNGLLVNSRRILRRALRHRDLIQVGPARVMYINEQANNAQPDPSETLCFARPGFPAAAGEEEASTLLAFGRGDPLA